MGLFQRWVSGDYKGELKTGLFMADVAVKIKVE
jgi:hypothetical protein